MRIYTKTGDEGETGLFGGQRIAKDADRVEAYGTVDELNAAIGVVCSFRLPKAVEKILSQVQRDLFLVGSELAVPGKKMPQTRLIGSSHIALLEKTIDTLDAKLPKLTLFILPGGASAAAHLHFARTVCRRAERRVVHLAKSEDIGKPLIVYLNRLSDLLFVLARFTNYASKHQDEIWEGRERKKITAD
ncbi:MAG: cob(I)yrinic acid a,c-diamide adenosyltransferase [Bacteroidota bacterium]|nr:cob(I)yrinic acid a,c-diamide adenosyltransferase [Bacteroidota bacterium]